VAEFYLRLQDNDHPDLERYSAVREKGFLSTNIESKSRDSASARFKKIVESIVNPKVIPQNNDVFYKVLGAVSKIYVGELTEEARKIQLEQ